MVFYYVYFACLVLCQVHRLLWFSGLLLPCTESHRLSSEASSGIHRLSTPMTVPQQISAFHMRHHVVIKETMIKDHRHEQLQEWRAPINLQQGYVHPFSCLKLPRRFQHIFIHKSTLLKYIFIGSSEQLCVLIVVLWGVSGCSLTFQECDLFMRSLRVCCRARYVVMWGSRDASS